MNNFPEDPKAPKAVKTQRLNYERLTDHDFNVFNPNGDFIGSIDKSLFDGYYTFLSDLNGGDKGNYFESWVMREIADQLDRLNKDWHDQLMRRIK